MAKADCAAAVYGLSLVFFYPKLCRMHASTFKIFKTFLNSVLMMIICLLSSYTVELAVTTTETLDHV